MLEFAPGVLTTMTGWVRARTGGEPFTGPPSWEPGRVERVPGVTGRPWHENPAIHLGLGGLFLAVFGFATARRPVGAFVRRVRRRSAAPVHRSAGRLRRLTWLTCACSLVVLLGTAVLVIGFANRPLPTAWLALRALATATALLIVGLVLAAVAGVREASTGKDRPTYPVVLTIAVLFVTFMAYWRLLG